MSVTPLTVFEPSKKAINWAQEALVELDQIARDFFNRQTGQLFTELDAQTGEKVWKARLAEPFPEAFGRKATEALNNTRHAFDQSVYAACSLFKQTGNRSINFPWAANPTDLQRLMERRGIPEELWDAIRKHEPYPRSDAYAGGDDIIRALATIANNKHTVGIAVIGHVASMAGPDFRGHSIGGIRMGPRAWDPVKNEVELLRYRGDADVYGECRLDFHVVLHDARLPGPVDAAQALTLFKNKGLAVLKSLEAACSGEQ